MKHKTIIILAFLLVLVSGIWFVIHITNHSTDSFSKVIIKRGLPQEPAFRKEIKQKIALKSIQDSIQLLGDPFIIGEATLEYIPNEVFLPEKIDLWSEAMTNNLLVLRLIEDGQKDKSVVPCIRKQLDKELRLFEPTVADLYSIKGKIKKGTARDTVGVSESDPYYTKEKRYSDPRPEFLRLNSSIMHCLYILANLGSLDDPQPLLFWIDLKKPQYCDCRRLNAWFIHQYYVCSKSKNPPGAKEHFQTIKGLRCLNKKEFRASWKSPWPLKHMMLSVQSINTSELPRIEVLQLPLEKEMSELVADQIIDAFKKAQAKQ